MNVYDEAHNLELAIKESEEYKQFDVMKVKVSDKPELEKMLKNFQQKQMAMQAKQMMGETVGDDMKKTVQELYTIVAQDPLAAEYLQCEMRFAMMMQDVYKILGDVVSIG